MLKPLYTLSALEIQDLFTKGELSALAIARYFLKRIEILDKDIGSFLRCMQERVLEKARLLDEKRALGLPLGKLAGVPIAIKDNIHVKGQLTTCASRFLSNYYAPFDATVTELLEAEDALLIGKTNLDEFAMGSTTENSAYFPTKNPWNLSCVPGGSSGGSAAAVSARLCPLSLGSDTGGSIRQPAALTGIVGFKPSYGRVSRHGLVAFASSLDQIGPFSTHVADSALIMDVIGKYCSKDPTSAHIPAQNFLLNLEKPLQGEIIGVPWTFLENLKEAPKSAFLKSIDLFKTLGCTIIDVDLESITHSVSVYYLLATAEAASNLARLDGIRYGVRSSKATTTAEIYELSRDQGFGREVKKRILLGTYALASELDEGYHKKAELIRDLIIEEYRAAFKKCSIIAMPTSPLPAFALNSIKDPLELYQQDLYTISVNLAGLPGISVPCSFNEEGKPFGLQLIGPEFGDQNVLSFAYAFEKVCTSSRKTPPLFDREVQ